MDEKTSAAEQPDLYTAEQAIDAISAIVTDALTGSAGVNAVIGVRELKAILDRVATGETITLKGVERAIIEAVNRNADGIATAHLWQWLRRAGDNISLETVEALLSKMELAGLIHSDRSGVLTVWKIGKAPGSEQTTGRAAKKKA